MKRNSTIGAMSIYDNPKFKNWEQLIGVDLETHVSLNSAITKRLTTCREQLQNAIRHQSYEDLAILLSVVKENAHHLTIITRTDLEEALSYCSPCRLNTAVLILERKGAKEAMLFLLRNISYYSLGMRLRKIPNTNPKII